MSFWDKLNPFNGDDASWVDVAVPFVGATRAAWNYGGKQAVDWGKEQIGNIGGGGDDKGFKPFTNGDPNAYIYGGAPSAGMSALRDANAVGEAAQHHGNRASAAYGEQSAQMGQRTAPQGSWYTQNAALASAGEYGDASAGYGNQLAGLEATEGPSAAQSQLQQGTNQALASQLALARSGRGMGGGAAAMGLAQGNMAGIQANQANQSAALRAQENAAWRGRQASNIGNAAGIQANAAGIQTALGAQYGQQAQSDLGAQLSSRQMNDQASLGYANLGEQAYGQGVQGKLATMGMEHDVRQSQTNASIAGEDAKLRAWAAQNGYTLQQQQLAVQKEGARMSALSTGFTGVAKASSDVRAKTNIAPGDGAGADFARRGLRFQDSPNRDGIYQLAEDDFEPSVSRSPTKRNLVEEESARLDAWARENGLTPMQAQHLEGGQARPGVFRDPAARPKVQAPDTEALDAAALDAVRKSPASFYDYKDPQSPGADAQRHYGPMAQDLAKTPAGASAVVKQPDGALGVDTGRLALVNTGALSEQQKQLDAMAAELEALKGKTSRPGFAPDFKTEYRLGARR